MKYALESHQKFFLETLESYFNTLGAANDGERELLDAMKYAAINNKAKYIRSFLVFQTTKLFGEVAGEILPNLTKVAVAIELIHAYSLVHDDLPAMDNSDFRRGEPSCHRKFSESTALLAGNSLLTLAFGNICDCNQDVIKEIINAAGFNGIMSGQVLDLRIKSSNPYTKEAFELMNYLKTGKLIEASCVAGPILLNKKDLSALRKYGKSVGRIFQISDDLLDEGQEEVSYIHHFGGKAKLIEEMKREIIVAKNCLNDFKQNDILLSFVDFVANRDL